MSDQWDEATLNCNYAEVNRELLASDNKEALLSAASESALFAKGTTTKQLCKRDPEVVRKVMGLTDNIKGKSGPPAMFAEKGIYREDETEWFLRDADKLIDG